MEFKYGFIYKDVRYGWNKKELYRLPFERNKRTFGLKKIPKYVFKSTFVYNVQRTKLTINKLKVLTGRVEWEISVIEDSDCPF